MRTVSFFQCEIEARVARHSLAADDRIRAVTSGCIDFLAQTLPQLVLSQLVNISAKLLHADRKRLILGAADLCEPVTGGSVRDSSALVFDGLPNAPPAVPLSTDVSFAAS